jgi:hypothetical protein
MELRTPASLCRYKRMVDMVNRQQKRGRALKHLPLQKSICLWFEGNWNGLSFLRLKCNIVDFSAVSKR